MCVKVTKEEINIILDKVIMQQDSPFFIKATDGKYIYINDKAADLAGLSPSDFLGKDDSQIFGEQIGAIYREKDKAIMNCDTINPIDIFTDKNGVTRTYFITRQRVYSDGELVGVSGIRTDISEYIKDIALINL